MAPVISSGKDFSIAGRRADWETSGSPAATICGPQVMAAARSGAKNRMNVDVRGGWTREVWHVAWDGTGYALPGLGESQVVLVDTPGINEVGGGTRGEMAREAAQRSDLVLFVTDSDLNETEHTALVELAAFHKPLIVVLNKVDLYTHEQRDRLLSVIRHERLDGIVPSEHVVTAAADPREREYVIQAVDGSERNEWRTPPPD